MRIDFEGIRERLDCREVVALDLGDSNHRNSKSVMYCCPKHNERKPSFSVFAEGYKCFACDFKGDVFSWVEWRLSCGRAEAAVWLVHTFHLPEQLLGGVIRFQRQRPTQPTLPKPAQEVPAIPPSDEWQFYANALVDQAEALLWSPEGEPALNYLMNERGLRPPTIRAARLGYVRAHTQEDYKYGRVFDPDWKLDDKPVRAYCGITIPHFAQGNLWAVRVRRPPGMDPKYVGVRGGSKALYWADWIEPTLPIVLFEGEFDCLVAWQQFGPGRMIELCPMALASASNHQIPSVFHGLFLSAPMIYLRMDNDAAGSKAAVALTTSIKRSIQVISVPEPHKDLTDFYLAEGSDAVLAWASEMRVTE